MGGFRGMSPEDVSLLAQDSPAARLKLAGWSSRITDMHRVAGVLASTLEDFVRSGQEHQRKTRALAEAFGSAGRTFSTGIVLGQGSEGGGGEDQQGEGGQQGDDTLAVPKGDPIELRTPSPGAADALTVLSDTLHQIAEYQKMLLSQTEELTLTEVTAFRDKTAILATRRDRVNEIAVLKNQAVSRLCGSSPQMVGGDGADAEYIKRATRAYTAKRAYARATVGFAADLGAFETVDKVSFLKRVTEQVFVHHGYFKQAAGVFDDAAPLATSFFAGLSETESNAAPLNAQMLKLRDEAAAQAHVEYSANIHALPKQRKVVVASAPAADKGGLVSTMKRLRQVAKEKINEVSERKTGLLDDAPPPSGAISPQEVTDRVLTHGKEGWVLRREKGAMLTSWKPVYLRVHDDTLIEVDTTGGPDKPLCNLALLNVRLSEKAVNDRLDCLDLMSPTFSMVLQAEGPRDCAEWQLVLSSGIVSAIHGRKNSAGLSDGDFDTLTAVEGNGFCADCQDPHPVWCSINLGIMVCLRCSGGHRALGVRFSKVRSAKLDAWPDEAIAAMQATGNAVSNRFYEHSLPPDHPDRPTVESTQQHANSFIAAKYVERRWADPAATPPGNPCTGNVEADGDDGTVSTTGIPGTMGLGEEQQCQDGHGTEVVVTEAGGEGESPHRSPVFSKTPSTSSMASVDLATPAHAAAAVTGVAPTVSMTPTLLTYSEEDAEAASTGQGDGDSLADSLEVAGMDSQDA